MEDALGAVSAVVIKRKESLNPCFNGRCSRRVLAGKYLNCGFGVLILVLMEDALGEEITSQIVERKES